MPDTIETLLRRLALTGATTGGGSVGSLAGSLAGYPLVAYANAIQPGNRVNPQTGYGSLNQFIQSVQAVQQPRDANEPIPSYLQGAPAANRLASRQRYTPDELLGASGRNSTNILKTDAHPLPPLPNPGSGVG